LWAYCIHSSDIYCSYHYSFCFLPFFISFALIFLSFNSFKYVVFSNSVDVIELMTFSITFLSESFILSVSINRLVKLDSFYKPTRVIRVFITSIINKSMSISLILNMMYSKFLDRDCLNYICTKSTCLICKISVSERQVMSSNDSPSWMKQL